MKLLSVVVLTYNRVDSLISCVKSILASTYQNMEIIIIDNHSTDNTQEQVQLKFGNNPMVRYVRMERNLMVTGGKNAGYREAKGDYILYIDCDNVLYPDMIELLVNETDRNPQIGLIAPLSINVKLGNTIWMVSGDFNFFTSIPKALYIGKRLDEVVLKPKYETCFSPNVYMVSRKAMEAVGGFDETFLIMYDESDLGYRIKEAGFSEYIITDARTRHIHDVGTGEKEKLRKLGCETTFRAFLFARNRTIFMKKHAKWYHRICYYCVFIHVFTVYYCFQAISCKRWDIARAWLKGTWKGIFWKKN